MDETGSEEQRRDELLPGASAVDGAPVTRRGSSSAAGTPAAGGDDAGVSGTTAANAPASSSSTAIGMFFAMDSVVGGDDAINIIEDGDHVSAEDFGLGSTDISMNAMASASSDMAQMELNALQIQAFLSRTDSGDASSGEAPMPPGSAGAAASTKPAAAQGQREATATAQQRPPASQTDADGQTARTSDASTAAEALPAEPAAATNAYEASHDVVFYSRREDKMKAIREHPIVAAVSPDGRQVTCKCGRVVRLNPPWYILKFEQHIVSRNCTFLRKKPKSSSSISRATTTTAAPIARNALGDADESVRGRELREQTVSEPTGEGNQGGMQAETQDSVREAEASSRGQSGAAADGDEVSSADANDQRSTSTAETGGGGGGGRDGDEGYALRSLRDVLSSTFGVAEDGSILPPPSPPPVAMSTMSEDTAATADEEAAAETETAQEHALKMRRQYEAAMELQRHPYFSRITPDGRFIECTCSKLIVLTGAWALGRFREHVAEKSKAPSKKKTTNSSTRRPATMTPGALALLQRQKLTGKRLAAGMGDGASFRLKKKSFPSEIRWDVAQARNILPCPGLRDEKMNLFVESAVHLTGGARPRHKIAQELFPHLYPAASADGTGNGNGEKLKISSQLTRDEKLLLHDAIEAEALWFIDKDGNSVRSLDCRGIVDTGRGESVCVSCVELRSNVSLRTAATLTAKKAKTQRNPLNRKFCSSRVFSALEAEFNMDDEYARILRDLSLAEIADDSALNMWFDMAEMGINGAFDAHSALLGLVESMVALKDKERRGVGMQNMYYSEHLDAFMRSVADISVDACDFFQHHLCGRKQKVLQLHGSRKRKSQSSSMEAVAPSSSLQNSHVMVSDSGNEGDRSAEEMQMDGVSEQQQHQHHQQQQQQQQQQYQHQHHHLLYEAGQAEGLASLLDASNGNLMPSLSINDIQDVDLSSFAPSSHMEHLERSAQLTAPTSSQHQQMVQGESHHDSHSSAAENQHMTDGHPGDDEDEGEPQREAAGAEVPSTTELPRVQLENLPCTGLRDEKVQAFVKIAVQLIGGSRPRYVIAKELFPHVFGHEKTVKIVEKLDETQKQMLQDAVFSECLWRIDKVGSCVRSLRCLRFTDKKTSKSGVCRACRDLKAVPNFRSVLSRAKTPKNLENVKYMPTTYTESDPFLRKLSKNASFRALYQLVKLKAKDDKKRAVFWLKCARMGVFGHFRTHPVFEGLMESMVEVKDKERRGVGKQNMQYSKPLDDFMNAFSAVSMEAFDLFASQFCGRTIRSQKVKKRKATPSELPMYHSLQSAIAGASDMSGSMTALHSQQQHHSDLHTSIVDLPHQHQHGGQLHHPLQSHHHHHHLMATDDLLGGRPMTASDLEESQRFMDRMLDEVRLSVSHDIQLHEEMVASHLHDRQQHRDASDSEPALEPRTYLDEEGVLTTEI